MSRKHAGGKCCPAGIVLAKRSDPRLEAFEAAMRLLKARKGTRWSVSDAATLNKMLLIGSGDLSLSQPTNMPQWMKNIGGKPRTKAQKRAVKRAKLAKGE